MNEYRVTLYEDAEASRTMLFDCMADDMDHAREQAINAYPECRIVTVRRKA